MTAATPAPEITAERTSDSGCVFLDLDGPILDTADRNFRVHQALVGELGGRMAVEQAPFWDMKRAGCSSAELLQFNPEVAVRADEFKRRWLEEIEAPRWLESDTVHAGVLPALEWLAGRWRIVLVTLRQQRAHLIAQLERLELTGFFSMILSDSPAIGPGWETKRRLIAHSGFDPFGVMVGDTEIDIRAGKLAGLGTVAVTCGIRDEPQLRKENPDVVADRLADLQRLDLGSIFKRDAKT